MLEFALKGGKKYWGWIGVLFTWIVAGFAFYLWQLDFGLGITGLSRDVSWGFYVAQLTFLVGIAASAVMLVLPFYLHKYMVFGRITIIGEFVAVSSICMCMLFLFVDLGQPMRAANIFLHPTPNSVIFWDGIVLIGYLLLNIIVGWNVLEAERNAVAPPVWLKPFIYISIPWAFAIHTVTAFLYCGLPGRGFWLTAILAPRFLASAFSSGPAVLILLCFIIRRVSTFDPGKKAIQTLAQIVTYGLIANVFFLLCEIFVTFYSRIPEHLDHFNYLYSGLENHGALVSWMWASILFMGTAVVMLLIPATRKNERILAVSCMLVFTGTWIDKGLGLISGGFIPSPLHKITEYVPTIPELIISLGVYGIGLFVLTVLLKIAVSVKEEIRQ
jgi:molybdopterin-containing oxidoreductase family membrane subunit